MRAPLRARALVAGTVGAGCAVLAAAAFQSMGAALGALALFAAAVVVTELCLVPGDEDSPDPLDAQNFSFSSGVHLAAVLVFGAWPAALIAAFGVVVVDGLRGAPVRKLAFNASVFALATAAGGIAFSLLGGVPGTLQLPTDFIPVVGLALTAYAVNAGFVAAVIAFSSRTALLPLARAKLRTELPTAAGEAGFGLVLGLFVLVQPWAIVAVVPLAYAVYQAHARLADLRRQTWRALETFANVVDERDPYTYRHSDRVGEYVRRFAEAIGLPAADVARLRWAGKLHDLGKISVDAAVLRKPQKLNSAEFEAMRRHPRISSRLVRRFRFAAEEALAVEYHHERADGRGYYGVDPSEIPLAAHFLVVADSYDAMTSDRPYRPGMSREQALEEIEANIGSQFHAAVGKAFVALERGLDPLSVLTPAERQTLRTLSRSSPLAGTFSLVLSPGDAIAIAGLLGTLVSLGAGLLLAAPAALTVAVAGLAWKVRDIRRERHLAAAFADPIAVEAAVDDPLDMLVERLRAHGAAPAWAGLVRWHEAGLTGALERARSVGREGREPTESALTSWLVREADGGRRVLFAAGRELGASGTYTAIPLNAGDAVEAYAVLGFQGSVPRYVREALRSCVVSLGRTASPSARDGEALMPLAAAS